MKILTDEIALREETRSLQQARPQLKTEQISQQSEGLARTQNEIADRTDDTLEKIYELPDARQNFRKEIMQLTNASSAMDDAAGYLIDNDSGPNAIAAETEAIEWLLLAKRSGGGGGGGGSDAGNGSRSGNDLSGSALARLGESKNKKADVVQRSPKQATGTSGRELPVEFRSGLDQYFEKLETQ